ncbi:hypothetical protein [Lyngbya sp. PCC 8106]|uniref:hypothetical protein n=1 Tax=Lyngbya sp. (strain PCC 8106) TaxID=313612 RepID=UPI0000EAB64F|nr:hypothetical protein [Lyngbya sp. PCC 8106]EAW35971.1 hypothetical protein L8106_22286 [Lyngbya sp. PCC 8106]
MFGRIIKFFTGNNRSEKGSAIAQQVPGSIDANTAPIAADGFGEWYSPNNDYRGIYVDGALLKTVKENGWFVTDEMVGESKEFYQRTSEGLRNMVKWAKNVTKGSQNSEKIHRLGTRTEAEVAKNHLRQHQNHNVLKASFGRTTAGYIGEQKRMSVEAASTVSNLTKFEARLQERVSKLSI